MVQIITTTPNELQNLINESVRNAVTEIILNQQPQQPETEFLTRQQTADRLHISLSTLDTYTKLGLLNAKRIGKRILYSTDEINDAMIDKINNLKHKMK